MRGDLPVLRRPQDLTANWMSRALGTGPDGGVMELDTVTASERVGQDGLITRDEIQFGELPVDVEPLAFGPLSLEAPDGRISQFPRAMCRLTAADGRVGLGWVEWNSNASLRQEMAAMVTDDLDLP
jgi:hypothetical protein